MALDIEANRSATKYSRLVLAKRVLWSIGLVFFRLTPRPFFGLRALVLRLFGASIGRNVHVYPSATIYFPWNLVAEDDSAIGENSLIYNLGMVHVGRSSTVSQRAHLCAGSHDYTDPTMPLLKLPIIVEANAWICADAFVGPGVTIGKGAVVGARAVVMKDVEAMVVVAGNPAREVKKRRLGDSRVET